MSTNISKQKREDLLNKIKEIRTFISTAPQDENTGNLGALTYFLIFTVLILAGKARIDDTLLN